VGLGLRLRPSSAAALLVGTKNVWPGWTFPPAPRSPRLQQCAGCDRSSIVTAIWHVLTNGDYYHDLGSDYYTKRSPEGTIRRKIKDWRRPDTRSLLKPLPNPQRQSPYFRVILSLSSGRHVELFDFGGQVVARRRSTKSTALKGLKGHMCDCLQRLASALVSPR
jgi:hypothetical protein